jgi:phage RecT family recombinase
MTLSGKPNMASIPTMEFVRCVLEAAEFGFAVDGKMAYILRYGKGEDTEESDSKKGPKVGYSLQFDYKALIAIAKRTGQIHSIDFDVVCEHDHFVHSRTGGGSIFEHTFDLRIPARGNVIGAYARVWHRDGTWTYEVMNRMELDKVQAVAPAKNGPWKTWPDEMRKKTVIKRILKRYREDASLCQMMDIDDAEFESPELGSGEVPSLDAVLDNTQSRTQQMAQRRQGRPTHLPRQSQHDELDLEDAESQDSSDDRREPNAWDEAAAAIAAAKNPTAAEFAYNTAIKETKFTEGQTADLNNLLRDRISAMTATTTNQPEEKPAKKANQKDLGMSG